MTDTTRLNLPMVQAAQAQKHVTVNEALVRLDALIGLELSGIGTQAPPASPDMGETHALGPAPVDGWAGQAGRLALATGDGWHFVTPRAGWLAWDSGAGVARRYDGAVWRETGVPLSAGGAATRAEVLEFDVALVAGGAVTTADVIPANCQVIGVSGRVIDAITGAGLSGWRLGVAGSDDRYGSGLGLALNSWARGLTGQPVTYYGDTALVLTPEGGTDFAGGSIRLAVHLTRIEPPAPV